MQTFAANFAPVQICHTSVTVDYGHITADQLIQITDARNGAPFWTFTYNLRLFELQ